MLERIARLAIAAPKRVIALAALVLVAAAVFGIPVAKSLSAGGFQDPASESARAVQLLTDKFGQSDQQLLVLVTAPTGAAGEPARQVGIDIVEHLEQSPHVFNVSSAWTSPPPAAAALVSADGKSGLIVANLRGGENNAQKYANTLATQVHGLHIQDGVTVRAGGVAMVYAQITDLNQRDLLLMESIAIPLSFLVLVWVFGGLLAAALPMALGALAIVGAMSVLRLIAFTTDVSIFALNLSTAMGLALAIDYTLLIISRYRDELADGTARDQALIRTMATAGRTVLFSATTVALSMAFMVLFPMYFLKSFAYAGVATVAFVATAAIVVTPAAIVLREPWLHALDVRRLTRRVLRRAEPVHKPVEQLFWYRSTTFVMRRAVPIGLVVVALLLVLGLPFLGVKRGVPDDRVLPRSAAAHQVGDQLRTNFADDSATAVPVVIPDARGLTPAVFDNYAARLSRVPDVSGVAAPTGTFVAGERVGPPVAATGLADGSAFLTLESTAPLFSQASAAQLDRLHKVPGPAGRAVEMAGLAQINRDSVTAVMTRLPVVLGLIAAITFVLLFLLTGSVVLPLKAVVLNVLSLSAAFGALVWIFQDGHLSALGTTPSGTLEANMPVLLFCIAFGLSMDYEVFLVSRIREYWLESGAARPARPSAAAARVANDNSVALGLARTGRVITAAALVMSISFAALIPAQVSFMRMFGIGLTLAVLVDATLVRMVLVPAFMHVLGRWNWWAPGPLAWLHAQFGISECAEPRDPAVAPAEPAIDPATASLPTPGSAGPAYGGRMAPSKAATVDNPFFARIFPTIAAHEPELLRTLRRENLAGLSGRVLEVGAGVGTNFDFYPDSVEQVVAVEPEPRLAELARAAAAGAPVPVRVTGVTVEEFITDEPFDAVVCSLVLCSVGDPDTVLRQLHSGLRPGGELRYLEHVASGGFRGGLQRLADATLWPRLLGNCHTHRDTERVIIEAGFEVDGARRELTLPGWVPMPVSEIALGRARRA